MYSFHVPSQKNLLVILNQVKKRTKPSKPFKLPQKFTVESLDWNIGFNSVLKPLYSWTYTIKL